MSKSATEKKTEEDSKTVNFFSVEDDDSGDYSDDDSHEDEVKSKSPKESEKEKPEDNGISREDAELVLDEYRSARTTGLPPPNVMFAASKKPEFLKASTVASKWDGEKHLSKERAERARKVANPDVLSAMATKAGDDWGDAEENPVKGKRHKKVLLTFHLMPGCLPCVRGSYDVYRVSEEDKKRHLSIEKQLREDARRIKSDRRLRVLLLGTGESGKTTFIKQIRIIYGNGFSQEERLEFRTHIYLNVVRGLKVLVDAMRKLNQQYTEPSNSQYTDIVLSFTDYPDPPAFRDFSAVVRRLWADAAVKRVADYGGKYFQFTESVKIFFEDIDRISNVNYVPTESDIVLARKPTKNIAEYTCFVERYEINFIDVGGQRSERKKWLTAFTGMLHSILFLVAVSEFDEVLFEAGVDDRPNRIREALAVFRLIINNRFLVERLAPIIFFNKYDLFQYKIVNHIADIRTTFPEYRGDPFNMEHVQAFFVDLFRQTRTFNAGKPFYYHFTTAIDTSNVKRVFDSIKHTILQQRMSEFGLQ